MSDCIGKMSIFAYCVDKPSIQVAGLHTCVRSTKIIDMKSSTNAPHRGEEINIEIKGNENSIIGLLGIDESMKSDSLTEDKIYRKLFKVRDNNAFNSGYRKWENFLVI